jgi:hypothetical protein
LSTAASDIKSFRAIPAVVDKTPFSFALGTSPRRFKERIASPELFTFDDAYSIAAFLKGKNKVTPADEKIIVNLIHDYSVELRSRPKKARKKPIPVSDRSFQKKERSALIRLLNASKRRFITDHRRTSGLKRPQHDKLQLVKIIYLRLCQKKRSPRKRSTG